MAAEASLLLARWAVDQQLRLRASYRPPARWRCAPTGKATAPGSGMWEVGEGGGGTGVWGLGTL